MNSSSAWAALSEFRVANSLHRRHGSCILIATDQRRLFMIRMISPGQILVVRDRFQILLQKSLRAEAAKECY